LKNREGHVPPTPDRVRASLRQGGELRAGPSAAATLTRVSMRQETSGSLPPGCSTAYGTAANERFLLFNWQP